MRKGKNAKRQGWGYTYSLQKEHSREALCRQWRTLASQERIGQTVEDPQLTGRSWSHSGGPQLTRLTSLFTLNSLDVRNAQIGLSYL